MSTFDYSEVIAEAQTSITEFGRSIKLVKLSAVPADVDKPWATPDATKEVLTPYNAVFVEPSAAAKLGLNIDIVDFLKQSTKVLIIATSDDLEGYHKVLDGTRRWTITGMTCLEPGDTKVLWFIGVGG